jgi:hypothetical protein
MNGLKDVTKEICEAGGGKKTSKFNTAATPEPDILDIANKAVKVEPVRNSELQALINLFKDHATLESESRTIDGTRITTVTLKIDDEAICDTDFYTN